MSIKLITPTLLTLLFLIGCGTQSQRATSQVNNQAHQVDMKLKTSREVNPEDEEYLNYMKIYNLNSLSFNIEKYNGLWSLNYNGNYDGKKAYYLDIDRNNQTGYYSKWIPKVGAEYLLEEGVLFKYTGADGTNEWSWDIVSYNGMQDFDHSVKSILAYGITINDDWSYHGFLEYYDTATPYEERDARFVRDEGKVNNHGAFYTAEDDEDFYIRALNKNYKQKENTKFYNYEFSINETNYNIEGNTLFDSFGKKITNNLLYELHKRYSIVIIPKNLLVSGDIKLKKADIKDEKWNTLNSYKYRENQGGKVTKKELLSMINNNEDYSQVDVSLITDMSELFLDKEVRYDITQWDVSSVTNMNNMFNGSYSFNQAIGDWDVSNVTDMSLMFLYANSFNQPIGDWDVSNVTDMKGMFFGDVSNSFNQPIGDWNVSNVTNMSFMFQNANSFNQPIGDWDVSNVTNMDGMFFSAKSFNQPIGDWEVSNVTNMREMFYRTDSFNQNISSWNVTKVTRFSYFYKDSSLEDKNIPDKFIVNINDQSSFREILYDRIWRAYDGRINSIVGSENKKYIAFSVSISGLLGGVSVEDGIVIWNRETDEFIQVKEYGSRGAAYARAEGRVKKIRDNQILEWNMNTRYSGVINYEYNIITGVNTSVN